MGILLFIAIILGTQPELVRAQTTATYDVTFTGNWNTQSTPGGVVGGAHFTTLIGAVHNSDVTFWAVGEMATAGVERVAELGITDRFETEIRNTAGGTVKSTVRASGTGAMGSNTLEVEFSRTHPLLTLLSMIGPSPDWFVGVSGLSMLDGSDAWRSSHTVDLFPYDAGTEDGEGFSLGNQETNPRGTITSLRGQGKFSDTPMARLSFTLNAVVPPLEEGEEKMCAVSGVTDDQSLRRFVECAAECIEGSSTFEETLRLLDEFRDDEGTWNDGSTYLVLLTGRGGVYFHAEEREAEDLDWSEVLSCEEGDSVLDMGAGEGCSIGSGSGYAHKFSASHVPLAHGGEFVLVGGFDETPGGEPFTGMIEAPSTQAGEVDTDEELREFVGEAKRALGEAFENEIDSAQLRGILRAEGPWREGDVYVYVMDETGMVIFDGEDRSREQKRTDEPGKLYVIDRIANKGQEAVGHTVGDFWIYAIKVEVSLDEGEDSRVYVVGSGYRVEERLDVGDQSGGSNSGGGGCAVGGSGSGSASGLFFIGLALLLMALFKRRSVVDKMH